MAPLFLHQSSFSDNSDNNYLSSSEVNSIESKKISQDSESHSISSATKKSEDAFLYYSNDEIRIKTLKLKEVDITSANENTSQQRKTRISFELDPMLILGDELEEMFNDEDEDVFSDIDFSHLKTGSKDSNMDLLAELHQM